MWPAPWTGHRSLAGVEQDLRFPAFLSWLVHSIHARHPVWPISSPISPFCRGPGRKLNFNVLSCKMGPDTSFPLASERRCWNSANWPLQVMKFWIGGSPSTTTGGPPCGMTRKVLFPLTHSSTHSLGRKMRVGGEMSESLLLWLCLYRPYCSTSL